MVPLDIVEKKISNNGELQTMHYLTLPGRQRLEFEKMCELISERATLNA